MTARNRGKRFVTYNIHKVRRKRVFSLIKFCFFVFLFYQILSSFLITPYRIDTNSMKPTLSEEERILATPLAYGVFVPFTEIRLPGFVKPKRGDLVLFNPPYKTAEPWYINLVDPVIKFFTLQKRTLKNSKKDTFENPIMTKRIIALPGDTIKVEDFIAFIKPQDQEHFIREFELIKREYNILPPEETESVFYNTLLGSCNELLLGEDQYFLLGDNRGGSQDSLSWGAVSFENIRHKILLSYWPKIRFR